MAKVKSEVVKKTATSNLENRVKLMVVLQGKIDKANKIVKDLGAEYDALERELLEAMQGQGVTTVGTAAATAYISNRTFVSFEPETGFDRFMVYVYKNKATDLLQRRINQRAFLDRLENGEVVPGVTKVEVPQVSLRRK